MENKTKIYVGSGNNKKEKDTHPDYRGGINVEGKEYDVSLWLNESKRGVKYFSVSVSEPFKKDVIDSAKPIDKIVDTDDLPF